MIVEPKSLFPSRAESAVPEPSRPSPSRGADHRADDRAGDGAFGRTLTDALRADRADGRPSTTRTRRGPDDRARRTDDRPAERPGPENHHGRRVGSDERVPTDQRAEDRQPTDGPAEDRPTAGGEHPATVDERRDSEGSAETVDEGTAEAEGTVVAAVGAAAIAVVEDVTVQPSDDAGTGQVAGTETATAAAADNESAKTDQITGSRSKAADSASSGGIAAAPSDAANDEIAAGSASEPVADITTGTPPATEVVYDAAAAVPAGVDADVADGSEGIGERIDWSSSPDGPDVEPAEHEDALTSVAGADDAAVSAGAAGSTIAAAAVAVSGQQPTVSGADPSDSPTTAASSTEVLGGVGTTATATLQEPATAGQTDTDADSNADIMTGDRQSVEAAAESADRPESGTAPVDVETAGQTPRLGNDRPTSGLVPAATHPASAPTPQRSAPVAAEASNPAELVELQTSGLAERLRPAFAAVRRGVNGLEELRLRIQDDNAGPIKVDIATVDNRVRVLLSAGNDDLMRQLGQERDRLADELRRAGFAQASIDIEAEGRGQRHGRFDQDASGRAGYGVGDPASSGAAAGSIDPVSSRRQRALTGLDLDL